MVSIWFKPDLSKEIVQNDSFITDNTSSVITDIITGRLDITRLIENLGGALTNKDPESREKGTSFFTKILKGLPKNFLNENQIKFISKFYTDRLNDNHRVIPSVLEGYLGIIDMTYYDISYSSEFLTVLFREIPCQSQLRQDRQNIYTIIKKLVDKDPEYMKSLGPDFVYGFISAMDSERDPRNLIFLFSFLPTFLKQIPLGHLKEEMFEVISCYYPIDFHPSMEDPAAVTREDLANALCPCLCAINDFAEQCIVLLIEKLDSSLSVAKIDSLRLLTESCKTFDAGAYAPFLKALWSSIHREITQKTDDHIKMVAHEALSALLTKLSTTANTDQAFESFVKGILIATQTSIAESSTVTQFVQATKIILTTANSSKEACVLVAKTMIPSTIAFYEFKPSAKLQVATLEFIADLYDLAKHWEVLDQLCAQVKDIPQLCLMAVSKPHKEFQMAGFKTLNRVRDALNIDMVVPFVEILVHNVQYAQDDELLRASVETTHTLARKYPEFIMSYVVKGKCDLENLMSDKEALDKRLNLLSSLASIDDFTKVIIAEMLNLITNNQEAVKVVEALSDCMSNTNLFSTEKLTQIESDHGLIDNIITWLIKELEEGIKIDAHLSHGYSLISTTISSLPLQKQEFILDKYTAKILDKCKSDEKYFLLIASLYNSVSKDYYDKKLEDIMCVSLTLAINSNNEVLRTKGCGLVAHLLNKAEHGQKFELLYELFKRQLIGCKNKSDDVCPKIIMLYGWATKALVLRGSEVFQFWLQKIISTLPVPQYTQSCAEAIKLIMTDAPNYLSPRQHCRISLLYKQRMFVAFTKLSEHFDNISKECQEAYMLSWAYVLEKAPKSVINNQADKICPILIDALAYENRELLLVVLEVLSNFAQESQPALAAALQTAAPRLLALSRGLHTMDVRIKSLQCLYEIANCYKTHVLLPYKSLIVTGVATALDDHKRAVRGAAVRARTRWYMVGAPGENKE